MMTSFFSSQPYGPYDKAFFTPKRFVFKSEKPSGGAEKKEKLQPGEDPNLKKALEALEKAKEVVIPNPEKNLTPDRFPELAEKLTNALLGNNLEQGRLVKEMILTGLNQLTGDQIKEIIKDGFNNFLKIDTNDKGNKVISFCKDMAGKEVYTGGFVRIGGQLDRFNSGTKNEQAEDSETFQPFTLDQNAFSEKNYQAIKAKIESELGHELQNGDRLLLESYIVKQEGDTMRGKKENREIVYKVVIDKNQVPHEKFVYKNNNPASLFAKDKVIQYLPNLTAKSSDAPVQAEVDGQNLNVVGKAKLSGRKGKAQSHEEYQKIASAVLDTSAPAKDVDIRSLDPSIATQIREAYPWKNDQEKAAAVDSYATLLEKANASLDQNATGKKVKETLLVSPGIRAQEKMARSETQKYSGDRLKAGRAVNLAAEDVALKNTNEFKLLASSKPSFMSLNKLEDLRNGPSGQPLSVLGRIDPEILKTSIFKDARKLFMELGLYVEKNTSSGEATEISSSVCLVDNAQNRKNLIEDKQADFNVEYKGKKFTVRIAKDGLGRNIYLAPGYDQSNFSEDQKISDLLKFNADEDKVALDKILTDRKFDENLQKDFVAEAGKDGALKEKGIIFDHYLLDGLNARLMYNRPDGKIEAVKLSSSQFLELIFSLYTFEDLNNEGCIQKVTDHKNGYALAKLPAKLSGLTLDPAVIELAYVIEKGAYLDEAGRQKAIGARERAFEKVGSDQTKIKATLSRIFNPHNGAFDETGKSIDMYDVNHGTKTDRVTQDRYYQQMDGQAALDSFTRSVSKVNERGESYLEADSVNARLRELYKAGMDRLNAMPDPEKPDPNDYYQKLKKGLKNGDYSNPNHVDIAHFRDWDGEIIKLGMLHDREKTEIKNRNNMRQAIIDKMADQSAGPLADAFNEEFKKMNKGEVTADMMKDAIKHLPFSLIASYMNVGDGKGHRLNAVDFHMPFVIPVKTTKNFDVNVILLPGIGAQEKSDGSWNPVFNLAIGASFEGRVTDNFKLFGGISAGVTGVPHTEANLGIGGTLGMQYRFKKASETGGWDHFVGLEGSAAAGIDLKNGTINYGVNFGPTYSFKIDPPEFYKTKINEYMAQKGLTPYIEKLDKAVNNLGNKDALKEFADQLKTDKDFSARLHLTPDMSPEDTVALFQNYGHEVKQEFDQNFDLPAIVGGQFKLSVVNGLILVSAAATGNVPVVIGTAAGWAIQSLSSLEFNVGSKLTMSRTARTSESEMDLQNRVARDVQLDKALKEGFASMPRGAEKAQMSGGNFLDENGRIRTEKTSGFENIQRENLLDQNAKLKDKGIQLEQDPQGRIKIKFLPFISEGKTNVKVLITPGIAISDGHGNLYLRNPNALRTLFVDKADKEYPFKTDAEGAGAATMESIIVISDVSGKEIDASRNPKKAGNPFDPEFTIVKYSGQDGWKMVNGLRENQNNKAEAYQGNIDYQKTMDSYNDIMQSLGADHAPEKLRDGMDFKKEAVKVYAFKVKGRGFLEITNQGSRKAVTENGDNYSKEELFKFFDDYADAHHIVPHFNGKEKTVLLLQCSVLRYIHIDQGQLELEKKWCRDNVLIPTFTQRIQNIQSKHPEIQFTKTATQLADEAIKDLEGLSLSDQVAQLDDQTSAAIAVGKGGKGFHHVLNANMDGYSSDYGYILGPNYNKALGDKTDPRHELALVLREQMAPLPDVHDDLANAPELNEFLNTPLSRSLLSIPALALVVGPKNYEQIRAYLKSAKGPQEIAANREGLSTFINMVKKVRAAEDDDRLAINIEGYDHQPYTFLLRLGIDSGLFNECGNYSALFHEKVGIVPTRETMKVITTGNKALTTAKSNLAKQFFGLTGALTATVDFSQLETPPPPGTTPVGPEGGPGPQVGVDRPQIPVADVPKGSGSSILPSK